MVIQFTGLSGAGKTTIAIRIKHLFMASGIHIEIIDGDDYRKNLCKDLGFSKEDRFENIRRLGKVADSFSKKNAVSILAAINPYELIRNELKEKYQAKTVYIKCDLDTLIKRDTKGLYKRALLPVSDSNKLTFLTGINDPYEIPLNPDIILHTDVENIDQCVDKLYQFIKSLL